MTNNIKDNEIFKELIRYKNNKMSNEERYAFERALERDPFLAETIEGMREFKSSDIEKDLYTIDLIAGKSKRKIRPLIYISAAASILILIVSIFLFNKPQKEQLAEVVEEKDEIPEPVVDSFLFSNDNNDSIISEDVVGERILLAEAKDMPPKENEEKPITTMAKQKRIEKKQIPEMEAASENDEVIELPQTVAALGVADIEPIVEPSVSAGAKSVENAIKKNKSINVRANETIIDDGDEASLEEVRTKRRGLNSDPEPLGGNKLFDTYIENNIQYPLTDDENNRKVVKLKFVVSELGIPTNFTIVRAPDNEDFSTEAIRLIKDGPKWSPAIKDGSPIDEEVVLRIVFKP